MQENALFKLMTALASGFHSSPADSVIIAISQVPQDRIVTREKDLRLNENGNLATDSHGETSLPGVFASGNVVTGAKTVVAAVAVSKQIAEDMDRYMKELD